ncbi:MAG TPA: peptidoglycan DD-metalloendopeptidase family protein [Hyphomicrobiaceae bacterium]|nr:peptidoglycan DD-metalloendopeptidase family protein [Hyphomicrobiaceae bacterium]
MGVLFVERRIGEQWIVERRSGVTVSADKDRGCPIPTNHQRLRFMLGVLLTLGLAWAGARAEADSSHSEEGIEVESTGLVPIYPDDYSCSPLTSLYASWIDVDGSRRDEQHTGVDGGRLGEWVVAPADGTVRAVWRSNWGWGWEGSLILKHTGQEAGIKEGASLYYSVFDHLDYGEIRHFKVGQHIARGERLGRVHRPGGVSDYLPEVHWEVWQTSRDEIRWLTNEHGGQTWFNPTATLIDPLAMLQMAGEPSDSKNVIIVPYTSCRSQGGCQGFTYILPCNKKKG